MHHFVCKLDEHYTPLTKLAHACIENQHHHPYLQTALLPTDINDMTYLNSYFRCRWGKICRHLTSCEGPDVAIGMELIH